jgi:hypothetical protein
VCIYNIDWQLVFNEPDLRLLGSNDVVCSQEAFGLFEPLLMLSSSQQQQQSSILRN